MMQATQPPETTGDANEHLKYLKPEVVQEQRLSKDALAELKKSPLKFSGAGELFVGSDGKELRLNPVLSGSVNYKDKLKAITELNCGFTGDMYGRKDLSKILSESHGYLLSGLPVHPAFEVYDILGDDKYAVRGGIAVKPIKIGRVDMSADILPFTVGSEKNPFGDGEIWLKSSVKLGKGISIYGVGKDFVRKGKKDVAFGKIGARYDFGKNGKNYIKLEARNWPRKYGTERDKSIYFGYGRRF